eukprot:1666532-Pyramimonas_sp.AAC.2
MTGFSPQLRLRSLSSRTNGPHQVGLDAATRCPHIFRGGIEFSSGGAALQGLSVRAEAWHQARDKE